MKTLLITIEVAQEVPPLVGAANLLADAGAHVHVLHVTTDDGYESSERADALVGRAVSELQRKSLQVEGQVCLSEGESVAEIIAREAKLVDADLIVTGSRGLGRIGALAFGSVSRAVLAATDVAVLIVPRSAPPHPDHFGRILAAIATQMDAIKVPNQILGLPRPLEVALAHVPRAVAVHVSTPTGTYAEIPETSSELVRRARAILREHGVSAEPLTPPVDHDVAGRISRAADQWHADLVVVGSRRVGDWESLLLGYGVSHEIVRRAGRPVLVAAR